MISIDLNIITTYLHMLDINVNVLVVCQTKDIAHSTTVHIVSIFAL